MNSVTFAFILTVALFVAHMLPLNSRFIEPNIIKSPIWWFVAFAYYFIIFMIVVYFVQQFL